jgi:hypothetical protein
MEILLTANDADGDMFGISVTAASTANALADTFEAALYINNADDTAASMTDAILIESTTASGITNAVNASDAEIDTALNAGANNIALTTGTIGSNGAAVIDFASFDVAGSGTTTWGNSGNNDVLILNSDNTTTNNQIDIRPANVSGTLIQSQYDGAATLTGAIVGFSMDLDTNLTPAAGGSNLTGILLTMDDNGASTSIGLDIDGATDFGIDLDGMTSGTDIRLSNGESISNATNGFIDIDADFRPTTADARSLGGASNEWTALWVADLDADTSATDGIRLGTDNDAFIGYDEVGQDRVEVAGARADLWIEDVLSLGKQAVTTTAGGATEEINVTSSFMAVTVSDDNDVIQLTETGALDGDTLVIVNVDGTASDTVGIDAIADRTDLVGGADVTLDQSDVITLIYSSDLSAWVQVSASNNTPL